MKIQKFIDKYKFWIIGILILLYLNGGREGLIGFGISLGLVLVIVGIIMIIIPGGIIIDLIGSGLILLGIVSSYASLSILFSDVPGGVNLIIVITIALLFLIIKNKKRRY